ncbi:hypothetical protein TRSC58_07583 [Trypanosoma rangeli SC58]|uniref:Secreted protein n=1 Tax=Trypanosoma rangeli SC58 TaxID=429131 RepID=A0A061ISK1_TRYRA|nr:hypothetical protein TRSC58_07583 [Trypanosoma rangeli SC58]
MWKKLRLFIIIIIFLSVRSPHVSPPPPPPLLARERLRPFLFFFFGSLLLFHVIVFLFRFCLHVCLPRCMTVTGPHVLLHRVVERRKNAGLAELPERVGTAEGRNTKKTGKQTKENQ